MKARPGGVGRGLPGSPGGRIGPALPGTQCPPTAGFWPGRARSTSCVRRGSRLRVCFRGVVMEIGAGPVPSVSSRSLGVVGGGRGWPCAAGAPLVTLAPGSLPTSQVFPRAPLPDAGEAAFSTPPPRPASTPTPPARPQPVEAALKCHLTTSVPSRTPGLGTAPGPPPPSCSPAVPHLPPVQSSPLPRQDPPRPTLHPISDLGPSWYPHPPGISVGTAAPSAPTSLRPRIPCPRPPAPLPPPSPGPLQLEAPWGPHPVRLAWLSSRPEGA